MTPSPVVKKAFFDPVDVAFDARSGWAFPQTLKEMPAYQVVLTVGGWVAVGPLEGLRYS